ncbi:hypothetical protein EBB54_06310 [Schaedlerella arabinosiphila]|uniref:Uncharacterized protein n=1 Tax=Schaedlerella arabinosiphila TaxID=2044587 RepID=A0A3R8KYA3_9FIRM|nr:hypothetical protein [Lachnospiraceae bacterium]RRK31028.1 hypothetical protein EBB54_06310 [Schaedlerella arabinosiphila]
MLNISEIVKKTEEMFDLFNQHFYSNELTRPATAEAHGLHIDHQNRPANIPTAGRFYLFYIVYGKHDYHDRYLYPSV